MTHVVLVDPTDHELGVEEKLSAHRLGSLHRAFSIFVFNSSGQLLLQRRAMHKYHSGGLWSNTCCGHPQPGEDTLAAAKRRLFEEMGMSCALESAGAITYYLPVGGGLVEHELDQVFVGYDDSVPKPSADEVCEWRWVDLADLRSDLKVNEAGYTPWLRGTLSQATGPGSLRRAPFPQ